MGQVQLGIVLRTVIRMVLAAILVKKGWTDADIDGLLGYILAAGAAAWGAYELIRTRAKIANANAATAATDVQKHELN